MTLILQGKRATLFWTMEAQDVKDCFSQIMTPAQITCESHHSPHARMIAQEVLGFMIAHINNFVSVRSFGIIGGGAVLFAASALAGVGPLVGEKNHFP